MKHSGDIQVQDRERRYVDHVHQRMGLSCADILRAIFWTVGLWLLSCQGWLTVVAYHSH